MIGQHVSRLRIVLGALVPAALLLQFVVVPRTAASYAEAYPEVAYLEAPYLIAAVVTIGGFEVALLAAWQLLSAAEEGKASTHRSQRWANVMTASLCFMALLSAGVCVHAGSVENIGGPAMLFGLLASLALVAVALGLRSKTRERFLRQL
ncbi:DUF2975 domain-containing protein [Arthrobacter sp. H5]|uniref:DUF2975 domain-containing protein n=1 Tax=Arthrobacter sp. H5 TaxID=1267973 RepID=UPI000482F762|nr:DUF2975 domain-containing protein [Arthrobacter sp. H5]